MMSLRVPPCGTMHPFRRSPSPFSARNSPAVSLFVVPAGDATLLN